MREGRAARPADDALRRTADGLRVLMTADTVGGVWSYVLELVRALGSRGVEVVVATMGPAPDSHQRAALEALPRAELRVSTFDLEWMDDPWDDVEAAGEWLEGIAAEVDPDVVHLNGFVHAALPFEAPTLVVAHSCVLSWWRAVKGEDAPHRFGRYRREVSRGLRAADAVAAPTAAMLRAAEEHYGPLPPARVVPNGRSPDAFTPHEGGETILACGRIWDEAKNLALLARVAPHLPWPVRVAGSVGGPAAGAPAGEGGAFPPGVVPLGRLTAARVAEEMRDAGLFVHPARYEPFGLGPLEAALSGCPLILGDLPSLREVWGDAAAYVDPSDAAALERTLLRLVADPGERRRLAGAARARARELGPWPMADSYLELYRSLARRRAVGRSPARARRTILPPRRSGLAIHPTQSAPGGAQ